MSGNNEASRLLQKHPPEPPSTPDASEVGSGLEVANHAVKNIPTTGMSPQEIVNAPTGDLIQVGTNAIGTDGSVITGLPAANPTGITYATTGVADTIETAAFEVGGAGSGIWAWITAAVATNPIGWGALALLMIAGGALVVSSLIGVSTPKGSPAVEVSKNGSVTVNPRLEIANAPLPDDPHPYQELKQPEPASPPATANVAKSVPTLKDLNASYDRWNCSSGIVQSDIRGQRYGLGQAYNALAVARHLKMELGPYYEQIEYFRGNIDKLLRENCHQK